MKRNVAVGRSKRTLVVTNSSKRCPHDETIAEPPTQRLPKANLQPLLQVKTSGHYALGSELDEEEFHQQERDAGRILRSLGLAVPAL